MINRKFIILAILAILVFGASMAQAATHFEGTVKTVTGDTLVIQVVKANLAQVAWAKEGKAIQINKKIGASIIGIDKEKSLVTVVVKKAFKAKVGDKVDIRKARRVMSGC